MNAIATIAGKEFRDGLRNRWVVAIALVLAVLAVGIAWFGAAASGGLGFTSLATTLVSLSTLAVFLIPLIALLLAYDAVVGEHEAGTLLLLLTYPLSRTSLLLGKFMGHGLILGVATASGFGIAWIVISLGADGVSQIELAAGMGLLIVSSVLLGWVFIAIAYLISVWATEKARAAGLALIVWFLFVLVFDLGLLALLVSIKQGGEWLPWLLLLNPTECFRLINLAAFEASGLSGVTSIARDQTFAPALLFTVLLAWILVPLTLAILQFRHRGT